MKIIAVYSENHTKHTYALMTAERKILSLNLVAHTLITRLEKAATFQSSLGIQS